MARCKTAVTPVLKHWSCILAHSHRYELTCWRVTFVTQRKQRLPRPSPSGRLIHEYRSVPVVAGTLPENTHRLVVSTQKGPVSWLFCWMGHNHRLPADVIGWEKKNDNRKQSWYCFRIPRRITWPVLTNHGRDTQTPTLPKTVTRFQWHCRRWLSGVLSGFRI